MHEEMMSNRQRVKAEFTGLKGLEFLQTCNFGRKANAYVYV